MQLEIYQWLAPLFSIVLIFRTVRQYFTRNKGLGQAVIWIMLWIGIGIIALLPVPTTSAIASFLGFDSNVNAIIFAGLGLLYLLVFSMFSTISRQESQITELVRKLAKENASQQNVEK